MSWLFGYDKTTKATSDGEQKPSSLMTLPDPSFARKTNTTGEDDDDASATTTTTTGVGLPWVSRAYEGYPAFTSTKFPSGPGLEYSCELPFGVIWTPMAPTKDTKIIKCPTTSLPPVLCMSCLAYLNQHCEVDFNTGIWSCALCGCQNVLPKNYLHGAALLKPALTSDLVEYHQPLLSPEGGEDSHRGGEEEEEEDVLTIMLVVDRNLDASDGVGIMESLKKVIVDVVKVHPTIRLGLILFDETVALYHLGRTDGDQVASADIFPVQEEEDEEDRKMIMETRPYLQTIKSVDDLESVSVCLSVAFNSCQSRNGNKSGATTGGTSRMQMLKERKEARLKKDATNSASMKQSPWIKAATMQTPKRCTGEALECALDLASVRNSRTSRVLLFTNGCPNMGAGSVVAEKGEQKKKPTKGEKEKMYHTIDDSQLVSAINYFDTLASLGADVGIAIDVICTGWTELGLPAYQALVAPSGGYVIPQSTLGVERLAHNLDFLLKHTYVSRTEIEFPIIEEEEIVEPPKKPRGLGRFFRRKEPVVEEEPEPMTATCDCVIDIRTDSFIEATHLVGPGEVLDTDTFQGTSSVLSNEKAAFFEGLKLAESKDFETSGFPVSEALSLSLTRIRIPRVDPLTTMSIVLQVNDTVEPEEDKLAFVQLIARFLSPDGKTMITRVSTSQLPVAESVSDFVANVNDEAITVVLAKNAVYRSVHGREETDDTMHKVVAGDPATLEKLAYEAQLDLDATIQRISSSFRLLGLEEKTKNMDLGGDREEKKESSEPLSSMDLAFPPQLANCVRRLYHLRRGALISPGPLRSADDRADARELFLRFTLEDCLGMMSPKLWSTGYLGDGKVAFIPPMNPFPAETMALWDAVCIFVVVTLDRILLCVRIISR